MRPEKPLSDEVVRDLEWRTDVLRRHLVERFWIFKADDDECLGLPSSNMIAVPRSNKTTSIWVHPSRNGRYLVLRPLANRLYINNFWDSLPPELRTALRLRIWRKRPIRKGDPDKRWSQFLSAESYEEARNLGIPV